MTLGMQSLQSFNPVNPSIRHWLTASNTYTLMNCEYNKSVRPTGQFDKPPPLAVVRIAGDTQTNKRNKRTNRRNITIA